MQTPDEKNKKNEYEYNERPLPERMRPRNLDEYAGQEHLIGKAGPLRLLLESGNVPSCILYGPPGVGKTTLVRLMKDVTRRELLEINAVSAKVAELRDMLRHAQEIKAATGRTAIAFVDEIYHFNTQQQNALLPAVETGELILIGSTTENPWFEINKTLLSRMLVYTLKPLTDTDLIKLQKAALQDNERGLGRLGVTADEEAHQAIAQRSAGDGRQALLRLEACAQAVAVLGKSALDIDTVEEVTGRALKRYDRAGDDHYAVISAFIKSMRGSDPDAAVYWLARMLSAGDDVRFIARRMCIFAAEDVGLADPLALVVAQSAAAACEIVGLPESDIILSQAAIYLAAAAKSNSAYLAIKKAEDAIEKGDILEVPSWLHTQGVGYKYPHDYPKHWVAQKYLPKERRFWHPGNIGAEVNMAQRMKGFWKRFSEDEA